MHILLIKEFKKNMPFIHNLENVIIWEFIG